MDIFYENKFEYSVRTFLKHAFEKHVNYTFLRQSDIQFKRIV